jgi:hypothetical protein
MGTLLALNPVQLQRLMHAASTTNFVAFWCRLTERHRHIFGSSVEIDVSHSIRVVRSGLLLEFFSGNLRIAKIHPWPPPGPSFSP